MRLLDSPFNVGNGALRHFAAQQFGRLRGATDIGWSADPTSSAKIDQELPFVKVVAGGTIALGLKLNKRHLPYLSFNDDR